MQAGRVLSLSRAGAAATAAAVAKAATATATASPTLLRPASHLLSNYYSRTYSSSSGSSGKVKIPHDRLWTPAELKGEFAVDLLAGFPVLLRLPVQWGEMDAFQHVNNVVYVRWFEAGRINYMLHALDPADAKFMQGVELGPILQQTSIRYRAPVEFPDEIIVATRTTGMTVDSMTQEHKILSKAHKRVVAEGHSTVVCFNYVAGKRTPWPEKILQAVHKVEATVNNTVPMLPSPAHKKAQ